MKLKIRRPDDMHVHFRRGPLMEDVVSFTSGIFGRAVVMPNTVPEILTGPQALAYRDEVDLVAKNPTFSPIMSIKITDDTTMKTVDEAADLGIKVAKIYPIGTTTGATTGVSHFGQLRPVLKRLEERDMIASFHCEMPGKSVFESEALFIPIVRQLAKDYPKLRIIVEHVSTREGVDFVSNSRPNVTGTVTPQHLLLTHVNVFGHLRASKMIGTDLPTVLFPHNFCKPVCNRFTDRLAVLEAVCSGNPRFFLGTDSAPHPFGDKQPGSPKPGVFNAPVALPLLAQIFENHDALSLLENFTSHFGADFYRLPYNNDQITLVREPWQVPVEHANIGIFQGGAVLNWKIA